MNNILNFFLIGIALSISFYISPIEANIGLLSKKFAGKGIFFTGSRFSEKRAITAETTHLAPIPWISHEKEINDNFVVANKIILGRKMRGEIGSESDRDYFYIEVSHITNISFKLQTSSDIGIRVYAEDQETILDEFTPETDESGEIVMGLQPGTYNILINRLPTSRFEKDLTYDLTVEPFCALACRNSLKRFERYSGEYDLKYEQENLVYTQLPNKTNEYYGRTFERSVIGEGFNVFNYDMVQDGMLNVSFWRSSRSYGKPETPLQSILTVEIFKDVNGLWILNENFNSTSSELINTNINVKKGNYLVGISFAGITEKNLKYYLKVTENENLDPPRLVDNSAEISLIPKLPTVGEKVSLRIKGELPASNAVIRTLGITLSGRLIVVDMETSWLGEIGAQVLTPVDTTVSLGSLTAGDQNIVLKVNDTEVSILTFEVLPIEDSLRFHVLAKVGRRESASPLRTRVDRSVAFTVYSFSRDDSSDMKIVENFDWTVPPILIGKIESVGFLDLTTIAKVDEEIIFRMGNAKSKFRVITTPSAAVEIVIDPPTIQMDQGGTQRFNAIARDKYGNTVVCNFGWHVVGDIGTIDSRRGDFKAGDKPGEGWVIAVANTQLIFSDVGRNLKKTGKIVVGDGTPRDYALDQNTPNPFNPSTQISFHLPLSSYVVLTVFNTLGQPVDQLINSRMNTGTHEVEWRPNNQPSGVYFYEIRAEPIKEINIFDSKSEPFVARKKMLLVR